MRKLCARISESALQYFSNIAITDTRIMLTYEQLMREVSRYRLNIRPYVERFESDKIVAVYLQPSVEAIISQIAILYEGATVLPLDSQTPLSCYNLNRFENIACVITCGELSNCAFPVLQMPILGKKSTRGTIQSCLSLPDGSIHTHCIMTSGSTGEPKAVTLKQDAILNQIDAKINLLSINKDSRLCISLNLSFVASIWQVFASLFQGGTIIMLDNVIKASPYDTFKTAIANKASIMCVTPSVFRAFSAINRGTRKISIASLQSLILTGELLHSDLIKTLRQETDIDIINAYGQTETADDTFHYRMPKGFDFEKHPVVPIGLPIPNISSEIRDGELCLKGMFQDNDSSFFHTGDSVSFCDELNAFITNGRKDFQIKFNGFRINPEAVEICCASIDGVADAILNKVETGATSYLQLKFTLATEASVTEKHIREVLTNGLPSYMVPRDIIHVSEIEYNSNGKKKRETKKID